MARSGNQKKKLITLREILLERTDGSHAITVREMIEALAAYGIHAERKSVYDDIEVLRELGMDVRSFNDGSVRGRSIRYYVAGRDFEPAELKLLADAVSASKFITEKKSRGLILKLASLAGTTDRRSLNRTVFVANRLRSANEEIYEYTDRIFESVGADERIAFRYFGWNAAKQKEYHRDGAEYEVSPWSLVWDDNYYYLVGYDHCREQIRHYRVDKMENVRRLYGKKRGGKEEFGRFDIGSACEGSMFGMFGGVTEKVTLSCDNALANVMIDRFGKNVVIINEGERFSIHVSIVPGETFYGWVAGFGGRVRIVSPRSVADEYRRVIGSALEPRK